ncbi:MAG: methyltransferase, partial [Flavobacteriales bacterium]|nr:methyltransferase [Flavobacteriales bacterium]
GKLICMTDIYNPTIDFASWYYKNDPTHVFIYQKETFEWIKTTFNFSELTIEKRLVVFSY